MSISDRMSELDRIRERMMRVHRRRIEEAHQRLYKPLTPENMHKSIDEPEEKLPDNMLSSKHNSPYVRMVNKNGNNKFVKPGFDVDNPPENKLLPGYVHQGALCFEYYKTPIRNYRAIINTKEKWKSFYFMRQSISNCGLTLINSFNFPMFTPDLLPLFDELVDKAKGNYPFIMATHNNHYKHWFQNWDVIHDFKNPNSGNKVSIYIK